MRAWNHLINPNTLIPFQRKINKVLPALLTHFASQINWMSPSEAFYFLLILLKLIPMTIIFYF